MASISSVCFFCGPAGEACLRRLCPLRRVFPLPVTRENAIMAEKIVSVAKLEYLKDFFSTNHDAEERTRFLRSWLEEGIAREKYPELGVGKTIRKLNRELEELNEYIEGLQNQVNQLEAAAVGGDA